MDHHSCDRHQRQGRNSRDSGSPGPLLHRRAGTVERTAQVTSERYNPRIPLTPGTRLGPYEVGAAIGAGGMGEVYSALDTRLNRRVAIKTLPESLSGDPERLARFKREAETLAALHHPHIATIFGFEQEPGGPAALVMELVEGPTLAERIAAGPIPLAEGLPIARDLATALEAAHDKGIVHRDLKPANVKFASDGSVKLLDFGLAKAFDPPGSGPASPSLSPTLSVMATQAGVILGTAAYMSPEQVRGGVVDRRADIWAYGLVLYEMLTGEAMFGGDSVSDVLADVLRAPLTIEALPSSTPRAVRQLIDRCLRRDAKQRLRDIGEARIAIEEAIAHPTDPPEAQPPHRTTTSMWLAGAAVAGLIVGLAAGLLFRGSPAPDSLEPNTAFDIDIGNRVFQRGTTSGSFIALSRSGDRLVFTAREGPENASPRLFVRSIDRVAITPLPGTEGAAVPFFSPDGQWVAFQSRNELKKVRVDGGVPLKVCDVTGLVNGGTWLDDGTIVIAMAGGLVGVPAGGGTASEVMPKPSERGGYSWPAPVPGKRAVLVTMRDQASAGSPGGKFAVVGIDLDRREVRPIADDASYPRLAGGVLLFAQHVRDTSTQAFSGGILAVPFDASRLATTGAPVSVLQDVRVGGGGAANFDIAGTGTMVYVEGRLDARRLEMGWLTIGQRESFERLLETDSGVLRPRLSPDDGTAIMQRSVGSAASATVFNIERRNLTPVPFDMSAGAPLFVPSAPNLVTVGSRTGQGLFNVFVDGSGKPQRLTQSDKLQEPGSWSADGAYLTFTELPRVGEPVGDIMILRRGDQQPKALIQTPADERNPAVSPDRNWLAYTSNESGRTEVYLTSFPEPKGRFAISSKGGESPVWSRDGRLLFFMQRPATLMRVEVSVRNGRLVVGAEEPAWVSAQEFGGPFRNAGPTERNFDLARDGRLLLLRDVTIAAPVDRVAVRLRFDRELARRVPTAALPSR